MDLHSDNGISGKQPKLKVLWFTNTPSLAAAYLNMPTIGGGWINSLEEKIKETGKVNLAVAFRHGQSKLEKFNYEGTRYYSIPDTSTKVQKYIASHLNRLNDEQFVKYCLEIVEDFKPDIINIFGTEDAFGLLIKHIKVPVVIHLQGILTVYETKWFSAAINKLHLLFNSGFKSYLYASSLIHNYHYFKAASLREQKIFSLCKYFLGRTDWDRRVTSVLSPNSKYFVSEELLRKEFYQREWKRPLGKRKIIISTIQANIYKGLETVLETSILLKKVNPFEFTWYIAGIPSDSVMIKLFERKLRHRFKDYNIIFLGRVEAKDLIEMELEADVFVHPSHIDNSPNSICEAMLLGMPVIATYAGGTGSLLVDKKEGILVQDGDAYSMAGAIIELMENPELANELGRNARQKALLRNDPGTIVNNVISIYADILSRHKHPQLVKLD